jgi:hypothetical protein
MVAYVLTSIGMTWQRSFPTMDIIEDFFFESNTNLVEFIAAHPPMEVIDLDHERRETFRDFRVSFVIFVFQGVFCATDTPAPPPPTSAIG